VESVINVNRRIGIEIEFVAPIIGRGTNLDVQRLIAEVMTNNGIRACARGYTSEPLPRGYQLAVEHDTSLQDESRYRGLAWSRLEVKTAPMTWEEVERPSAQRWRLSGTWVHASTQVAGCTFTTISPKLSISHRSSATCNTCGGGSIPYCTAWYPPAEERITSAVRRVKTMLRCSIFVGSYSSLCDKLHRMDRYHGLNLVNLAKQERITVEWRIHGGTTEWSKIRPWVLATQRWVEHAVARSCHYKPEPIANTQAGLNALLVTTGLKSNSRIYRKVSKDLRQVGKYLLRRWKHFNVPRDMKAASAA
jgi:hypothetical protein